MNIHVADGGTVVIREGTTMLNDRPALFLVEGNLILESCMLDQNYQIVVRQNGHLTIDSGATVKGIQHVEIADMDSRLVFNAGSTMEMRPGAEIHVSGIVETDPNSWCRLQALDASSDSLVEMNRCWYGLVLDWHVDPNTNIKNMFVHHGWPGIWVNDGSPNISDCQFSYNMIGLTLTQGAALVSHNTFRDNAFVGLNCYSLVYSAPFHNRINSNDHIGLQLGACANHWYSNTLDSNTVGTTIYDNSGVTFNQWSSQNPRNMCDTTHGNGIRYNATGVYIHGNSSAEFHCDNSVYGNFDWSGGAGHDLAVSDQCRIVGWGNYPDSIPGVTADTLRFVKVASAILQWSDPSGWNPSPSSDPVLRKTVVSPFRAALARAQEYVRLGLYQMAQTDYAQAATESSTPTEMLESMHGWRGMIHETERNAAPARATNGNAFWSVLQHALENTAIYADSAWKRHIASELLSVELVRKRDTTLAMGMLATLSANGIPEEYRRRALLRSVYTHYILRQDYTSAMGQYQHIAQYYPKSLECFEAKMILRLPIDSVDLSAIAKSGEASVTQSNTSNSVPSWIAIEGPVPNPMTNTAVFTITSTKAVRVRLEILDLVKWCPFTVYDNPLPTGAHQIVFDGSNMPAGAYLYRAYGFDDESDTPFSLEGKFIIVR